MKEESVYCICGLYYEVDKFIDVFKIYDKVMEDRYLDPADYE